jgi:hypothetical protein
MRRHRVDARGPGWRVAFTDADRTDNNVAIVDPPSLLAGVAIGAAHQMEHVPHDPADLTDREGATAWGYGRANHMIRSGQFLVQPPERPAETVPARPRAPPGRAMLGPFASR